MVFTENRAAGHSVRDSGCSGSRTAPILHQRREVEELARYAMAIEKHYGRPMDIEWGRDGEDGKLYILQARPETVKATEEEPGALSPEEARR